MTKLRTYLFLSYVKYHKITILFQEMCIFYHKTMKKTIAQIENKHKTKNKPFLYNHYNTHLDIFNKII